MGLFLFQCVKTICFKKCVKFFKNKSMFWSFSYVFRYTCLNIRMENKNTTYRATMKLDNYELSDDSFNEKKFYRHKNRITEHYMPIINLAIINDNKKSKAYMLVEPNDYFGDRFSFTIFWRDTKTNGFGELNYRYENEIGDYLFASELLKFIHLDFELTYCGIELFNKRSAEVFIQTFQDYHDIVSGVLTINQ